MAPREHAAAAERTTGVAMSSRFILAVSVSLLTAAAAHPASAQTASPGEPVRLTVGHPDVDARRLPAGRSSYLMRLGDGDAARTLGVYTVEIAPREGDDLLIVQTTRGSTIGAIVDSVLVRGRAMTPVWYRMRSSRGRLDLRYEDDGRRVRGTEWNAEGEVVPIDTTYDEPRYPTTIAMVLLRALPLDAGYAVEMPLSRRGETTLVTARVAAREPFEDAAGADGARDAWRLEVAFDGRPATRWLGVDDGRELATHTRLPNGSRFRQTLVELTPSAARARSRLRAAIDATGGEALLRGLGAVRIETIAYTNMLEQSERPEGPYIHAFEETTALRDPAAGRLRRTTRTRMIQVPEWSPPLTRIFAGDAAAVAVGERAAPGRAGELEEARESLALGPERVLLTALAADDVHSAPDTVFQGAPHHIVAFTWQGRPVRVFLNAYTHLPTAVERTRALPWGMWAVWGDVTTRTLFSLWMLEPNGLMYPRQWTIERNGLAARDVTITRLELGAAAPADSFAIPAEVRAAFHAAPVRGLPDLKLGVGFRGSETEPQEIAPGIVFLPGAWNVTLVRQEQGVVVLEAPIASGYTAQVVAEAARRMPGAPVIAAVSTSDAWPHVGGVRGYVARGVPVYAHMLNLPLLRRLLEAPHTYRPDSLALAPRAPDFRPVDGPVAVGDGPNRFVLHPIRGEGGERMVAAYFPEHRLLYASDLVQPMPDGTFFMTEYLHEVRLLVEREGLDVETVFAMHAAPMPWSKVLGALP